MSKRIFLSVLLAICLGSTVKANTDSLSYSRPSEHWFVYGQAGIQGMTNITRDFSLKSGGMVTPSFDLGVGKWFSPQFGARLGLQAGPLGHDDVRFGAFYLHGDLMWDVMNRFAGYDSSRKFSVVPYGHFGLLTETKNGKTIEHEYAAGAGLVFSWLVNSRLAVYLDGRTMLLNGKASQGLGVALANTLGLGVNYSLGSPQWHKGSYSDVLQNGFWQDWMVSVGAGVNFLNEINFRNLSINGRFAPAYDVTVGKWVSPSIGVRAGLQGGQYSRVGMNTMGFLYPHADLLWNVSNTIHPSDLDRFWTVSPYVHVGAIWEYDAQTKKTIEREYAAGAGLFNRFRFWGPLDLFLDLRASLLTAAASGGGVHSVGLSALGGLMVNINRSGWPRVLPVDYEDEAVRYLDNGFLDNWFAYGAAGVGSYMSVHRKLSFNGRITPGVELGVGKWFSPKAGARLGVQFGGLSAWGRNPASGVGYAEETFRGQKMFSEHVGMTYLHGDILWNAGNSLYGYDPYRRFDIVPYMHFGLLWETGPSGIREREFAAGAGLLSSYFLTPRLALNLDLRASALTGAAGIDKSDSHPVTMNALLGLSYALGNTGWYEADSSAPMGSVILNDAGANWWLSAMAGVSTIGALVNFDGKVSPAIDIALGKWLSPSFGLRLGWQGRQWQTPYDGLRDYGYVHGDLLWNVVNTIDTYKQDRIWGVIPYIHMGYLRQSVAGGGAAIDRAYAGGVGLLGTLRIMDGLNFNLDLRSAFTPSGAAGSGVKGPVFGAAALAGLSFDLGRSGWDTIGYAPVYSEEKQKEHADYVLGSLWDQWFVSVTGGMNLGLNPGHKGVSIMGAPTMAGEFGVGKWFSPSFGARGAYQGMTLEMSGNTVGINYVHADLLWNLSRTVSHLRPHVWEVVPYMHFGGLWESDPASASFKVLDREFASGAGLLNLFHIHDNVAITADLRGTVLTNAASPDKTIGIGGMGSLLVGLQLGFDPAAWNKSGHGYWADNFFDHWFITVAGGAQYNGAFQPAAEVALGKWFSPSFGARAAWQGGRIQGQTSPAYGYNYFHGDFLCNLMPGKAFQLMPYAHMGMVLETLCGTRPGVHERDFAAGAGLISSIKVGERVALQADLRATVLKGDVSADGKGVTVAPTALLGLSYSLGDSEFESSDSEAPKPDQKRHWSIGLNALDLAELGTVGVDFQYGFARHWSATAQFKFNPWMPKDSLYDKTQTFAVGARWWPWYIYSGLWVEAKAQCQGYKRAGIPAALRNAGIGHAYGAGVQAGYSMIICPWLNLDFGAGVWGGRRTEFGASGAWFMEPEAKVGLAFIF